MPGVPPHEPVGPSPPPEPSVLPGPNQPVQPHPPVQPSDPASKPISMTVSPSLQTKLDEYKALKGELGTHEAVKDFMSMVEKGGLKGKTDEDEEKKNEKEKEKPAKDNLSDARKKTDELLKGVNTGFTDTSSMDLKPIERPKDFAARYLTQDWEMKTVNNVDNPETLTDEAWATILATNKVFHGFTINQNNVFSRARYPVVKGRIPRTEPSTSTPGQGDPSVKKQLYHPAFEVYDDSSITVKETKRQSEFSMADNNFSSDAIQASISGGAKSFGFAASGGFNNQNHSGIATGDFSDQQMYTACYTFPRARLFIDEETLDATDEVIEKVKEIVTLNDKITDKDSPPMEEATELQHKVQALFTRYGNIFVTKCLLGGQLTASKSASAIQSARNESSAEAMKFYAAASIESSYFQVSASGSREKSKDTTKNISNTTSESALAWGARGGNTLLAASPAAWANSVANFQTWRTMEHDGVYTLPYLLSKIKETNKASLLPEGIETAFDNIANYPTNLKPSPAPSGHITWSKRFKLIGPDGTSVRWDGTKLLLSTDRDPWDATIFHALDATITQKDVLRPELTTLRADYPLFLPTADNGLFYSRAADLNGQIPGICVDGDGYLHREVTRQQQGDKFVEDNSPANNMHKICRWSLGKAEESYNNFGLTKWRPDPSRTINDGEKVKLYCHSFFSGGYVNLEKPPFYAPCVHWNPASGINQKFLRVPKYPLNILKVFDQFPTAGGIEIWNIGETKSLMEKSDDDFATNMNSYDGFKADDVVERQFESLRNIYGIMDATARAAVAKDFAPPPTSFSLIGTNSLADWLPQKIQMWLANWRSTSGDSQECVFTVKFVA